MKNAMPIAALACALLLVGKPAASATVFNVTLDGSQEVGGGDPTGTGFGTLTLDPVADTIAWNIDYSNLSDPFPGIYPISLSGWHVHGPDGSAGSNAGILISLGDVSSGPIPNGNLTGMLAADGAAIDSILANPGDFYLNLHTSDAFGGSFAGFPGGAIRGQVPEPSTAALLALGLVGVGMRGRRSR